MYLSFDDIKYNKASQTDLSKLVPTLQRMIIRDLIMSYLTKRNSPQWSANTVPDVSQLGMELVEDG